MNLIKPVWLPEKFKVNFYACKLWARLIHRELYPSGDRGELRATAACLRLQSHLRFSRKCSSGYTLARAHYVIVGIVATIVTLSGVPARADDDLLKRALEVFIPIPSIAPAIKGNAVTHEKVELGKLLFFDPRLSASEVISCNSCHNLATGGVDAGPTSVGHGWQKGPRRAPTVYNAVFNVAQFWDGRAADLKAQAKSPVLASVEMHATPDHVVKTLTSMPEYAELFKKVFPNEASPVTFDNFAKAVEAFEATLIRPPLDSISSWRETPTRSALRRRRDCGRSWIRAARGATMELISVARNISHLALSRLLVPTYSHQPTRAALR
jgi:hypothetical protein